MRPGFKLWTAEEDELLRRESIEGSSIAEIAKKVGRTESALRARAYVLRILLTSNRGRRLGQSVLKTKREGGPALRR
jgi:hypothetical protein